MLLKTTQNISIKIILGLFGVNYLQLNEQEILSKLEISEDEMNSFLEVPENEILAAFKKNEYKKILQIIIGKIKELATMIKEGKDLVKCYENLLKFIFNLKAIHIRKFSLGE